MAKTQPAVPIRQARRTTEGSKRVGEYLERNNLAPMTWYIEQDLHDAVTRVLAKTTPRTPLQAVVTAACQKWYGAGTGTPLPKLVAPSNIRGTPHKRFTWYAPLQLHDAVKLTGLKANASIQQLITSAVVDFLLGHPEIKALGLERGVAAFKRAPSNPM
jgi:hypothetical protein